MLAVARRRPYLEPMSWFPKPSSPRAALRDLFAVVRHSEREQRIGAALAFLVTLIIVIEFIVDAKIGMAPPPQIVEVQLYPSNRTDAQIIADQKKDMAERAAFEKEKQRQFQKLEKQLGM
jgi:hypothetical protein